MEIDRLETAGGQCLASRESGRWVFHDGEGAAKPPRLRRQDADRALPHAALPPAGGLDPG